MILFNEKMCPVCKNVFRVTYNKASRLYPKSSTIFCSHKCALNGRFRRGVECKTLSTVDAAYIAGFLDGEGSIMLIGRGGKKHSIGLRVVIAQSEKSKFVLNWISSVTGIGNCVLKRSKSIKQDNGYTWVCHSIAAEGLLMQLLPFLKIKLKQAEIAISFQDKLRNPSYKSDANWQTLAQNNVKTLNRRGQFTYQLTCTAGG